MNAYCPTSKFRCPALEAPLHCPMTGAPLEYSDAPRFAPEAIDPTEIGLWRYAAMLPVVHPGQTRVTLGEGWTPLIHDEWAGLPISWKLDALMPTGSYKDRGVSVMVNWLKGLGYTTLVDDSSGNAGASLACYAGRAGLSSCIFVPTTAPEPKKAQVSIYGGELVEVPGGRAETTKAAEAATYNSRNIAYASHAWHPAFLLGQMTVAWEIWEQLGRVVPDWLVAPTGHGGTLLGAWRGFQHLRSSGVTNKLPKLIAVQATPYTPVYDAFHNDWEQIHPDQHMERISADGIRDQLSCALGGRARRYPLFQRHGGGSERKRSRCRPSRTGPARPLCRADQRHDCRGAHPTAARYDQPRAWLSVCSPDTASKIHLNCRRCRNLYGCAIPLYSRTSAWPQFQ